MIVYRELSSLQNDLGISEKALYSVSNSIDKHYHRKILEKANGEQRFLYIPSEELKTIQRKIVTVLLSKAELSPYATAYRYGTGPSFNASVHVGKPVLLKLDIRHFFDKIIYPAVKDHVFPDSIYSEQIRILLTILCTYKGVLPQGAPSSPAISNLVLREFDNTVGAWCNKRKISYTRYCDDMTFSGNFNPEDIIRLVKTELQCYGFFLNEKKTKVIRDGQQKTVTGYVVNEKLSVASDYRRKVRQEMHYCIKFGVDSHLAHIESEMSPSSYLSTMLGRVNFILSVDKQNEEFLGYRKWLSDVISNFPQNSTTNASTFYKNIKTVTNPDFVHIPYFGKIEIMNCPAGINLDGMDGSLFPDRDTLNQFVKKNFFTFRKSGKNYAVCRGENSLAAVILIADGILCAPFFQMAKRLLCEDGNFWHTISEKTLGNDIRNRFPPFYTGIISLFKEYGLVYTNISNDNTEPAAIVIPNYDKLISAGLPRSCRKEVLQRGIGFLAGEKNGIILESLYGVELLDDVHSLGRIADYKNRIFTIHCNNGRERQIPIENCEGYLAKADWNPDYEVFFGDYINSIAEIESTVEYDRIGAGQENTGLTMRNNGYTGLIFKMQ